MKKNQNIGKIVIISIIAVIVIGTLMFKKPSVTGKVVQGMAIQGQENIHNENLNLEINESGSYEWQIKNPGSIKSLKASGTVSSNGTARVYIEKNGTRQLIFDSTKQLFDIDIRVLPEYKKILQGDKILIQNTLLNLRGFGAGNVNVEYSIKDPKGNVIAVQEETVYIETQAKFIRELVMPEDIKAGTYVAFVEASTNGTIVGTGSDTFEVQSKYAYAYSPELRVYVIGVAVIVALVIIFVVATQGLRSLKKKQKIAELKERIPLEKTAKLKKELKALEEARKAGFISEESYKREKKRIEEILKR